MRTAPGAHSEIASPDDAGHRLGLLLRAYEHHDASRSSYGFALIAIDLACGATLALAPATFTRHFWLPLLGFVLSFVAAILALASQDREALHSLYLLLDVAHGAAYDSALSKVSALITTTEHRVRARAINGASLIMLVSVIRRR